VGVTTTHPPRQTFVRISPGKGAGLATRSGTKPGIARQPLASAAKGILLSLAVTGCVHSGPPRPVRHISYWEALSELHPAEAVSAARTPAEMEFAEALGNLMAGDIEKAEQRFAILRTTATDSTIRAGSRVVYTATLQYLEKWQELSALKNEPVQPFADVHDKASIELWADAFKNVPPKVFTFRAANGRLQM